MKLDKFYFYSLLSDAGKQLVQENLKPFSIQKNTIIYYAGEVCTEFFLVDSGKVKIYVQGDEGQTFTLYTIEDGKPCIINTFSTIFSNVTIANAVTLQDTQGWTLKKDILLQLLASEAEYSAYLFSAISQDISSLVNTIEDVQFTSLGDRIKNWILSQKSSMIQTTHEEIATNLGTSRPIISKLLKDMEKKGEVLLSRGSIEILASY
jgi:CRP/FNR family transcriptional regulator